MGGPPLDPPPRDGQNAADVQPYPANGDGDVTSDGGKGNFVIRQGGNGTDAPAGAIAFSFTQTTDTTGSDTSASLQPAYTARESRHVRTRFERPRSQGCLGAPVHRG